jgi:transcriptional regulator with XRE-family HTH domain/uncharacterized protein YejL (UPF0352 family)
MPDTGIGARVARWRRRRGISQVALAGLVGRSESWLSQVERGVRDVDNLSVLRELARVLRIDLDELAPDSPSTSREHPESACTSVERAFLAPSSAEPVTESRVASAHALYQDARYADVLADLPALVEQLTASKDPRVLAVGWTVTAKILTKIGEAELALLAADRARDAARRSGDRADLGMATYQIVCALLPTARATVAEDLAVRTASTIGDDDDAVRSVAGANWLVAAIAAARRGDSEVVVERLDRAQRLADALGRDANLRWTAFGPTNVALHRVSTAVELGDAPMALAAASELAVEGFAPPLRSRRVQVGLDVAWAHTCRRNDADAVLALLDVERAAPDVTRHNDYARSTISTLLGRARGSTGHHVRALATRSGVGV